MRIMISYQINEKGTESVGLSIKTTEKIQVSFPIGYQVDPESLQEEVKTLLKFLARTSPIGFMKEPNESLYPISSALFILNHFKEHGLYQESTLETQKNGLGKINWKRTIKENNPRINGHILYQNIWKDKINYYAEKEIQNIEKYCLLQISKTIGVFFDFYYQDYPKDTYHKEEMLEILRKERKKVNQDSKLRLLDALEDYIQSTSFGFSKKTEYYLKYKEFQYIFQDLVDCLGVKGEEKQNFYPSAGYYYLINDEKNKEIKVKKEMPDTVIKAQKGYEEFIFLLDAKYYEVGTFPNEYDIFKQVRYEEYITEKTKNEYIILNAFVLPGKKEEVEIMPFYGRLDYSSLEHKIYVVYVNTKELMKDREKVIKEVMEKLVKVYRKEDTYEI